MDDKGGIDKAHFASSRPAQNLAKLAVDLAKLDEADLLAMMQELSIDDILVPRDSDDEEGEQEDNEEEGKCEEDAEMEEGEIPLPCCPTFWTTRTNTNPFTSKWGKTIGGSEKKRYKKKTPCSSSWANRGCLSQC